MVGRSGTELLFRGDGDDARSQENAAHGRRASGTPPVPRNSHLSDPICGMGTHGSFVCLAPDKGAALLPVAVTTKPTSWVAANSRTSKSLHTGHIRRFRG